MCRGIIGLGWVDFQETRFDPKWTGFVWKKPNLGQAGQVDFLKKNASDSENLENSANGFVF